MKKKTPMKAKRSVPSVVPMIDTKRMSSADESCACASCPSDCGAWGIAFVRVVVGLLFLLHGVQKLMGMDGVSMFFQSIGIPGWFAWIVAIVETLGGLALVIGVWTRWASYLLGLVMIGAFTFAAFNWGWFGWLLVIVAAASACSLNCGSYKKLASWALGIVLAVVVIAALWLQVKGGINPMANLERDLAFMAALFMIAWTGPGACSAHSSCSCCE